MIEKVFPAKDAYLDEVTAFLEGELEENGCSPRMVMPFALSLEEMFINVAHYAYAPGEGDVKIGIACDETGVQVQLTDHGMPFDPLAREDPDITLSAQDRSVGGLGIYMVKQYMDEVHYEYRDGCNIFTMRLNRSGRPAAAAARSV